MMALNLLLNATASSSYFNDSSLFGEEDDVDADGDTYLDLLLLDEADDGSGVGVGGASTRNHTVSLPPAEELNFFFEFFLPGCLLNGVGILGLVGNLLSIFILSRPQMKGSTNCILIGLATYDIILILSR